VQLKHLRVGLKLCAFKTNKVIYYLQNIVKNQAIKNKVKRTVTK